MSLHKYSGPSSRRTLHMQSPLCPGGCHGDRRNVAKPSFPEAFVRRPPWSPPGHCLLYTSDAADDM
eukprot:1424150-Alexandrium_andersonii.AAC.1